MKYAFINGVVLSGREDMRAERGLAVLTEGEKITAVLPREEADLTGYTVIDLTGMTLMPGLVNLHVHLPASGKPKSGKGDVKKLVRLLTSNPLTMAVVNRMCAGYARTELLSGVTTLRTVGGVKNVDAVIRDRINSGKMMGPRLLASTMAVSVPGGHMAGSLAYEATTPEEAVAFVDRIARDKPDLIKLMITGGVLDAKVKGEPGELKMQPELVKAACDEAHRLGLPVAAHVESPEGVRVALENGVDTIEHGAAPDEEILRLFRERNACLVATLSPALPYALFDRSVSHASELEQFNGNVVFEGIISCAKKCLEAGITVGLGTDTGCPYITHYDMWRELVYFARYCGVSNRFAIHTATAVNAAIGGVGDVTGTVEAGKCADLLIVRGDPLADLTVLRDPAMVMARGNLIPKAGAKKYPECDRELDKFL